MNLESKKLQNKFFFIPRNTLKTEKTQQKRHEKIIEKIISKLLVWNYEKYTILTTITHIKN